MPNNPASPDRDTRPTVTPTAVILAVALGANTGAALAEVFGVTRTAAPLADVVGGLILDGRLWQENNTVGTLHVAAERRP